MRLALKLFCSFGLLTSGAFALPGTESDDGPVPFHNVDALSGAFTYQVPFEVPAYRALTPSLGLSYHSGGGNGQVGVGWSLSGFSFVTRVSPGHGAPRFDSTDVFLLDGEDLVKHTSLGGTHATRVQSFRRITQDTGANTWIVTDKTGTRTTYTANLGSGGATTRWAVSSIEDLRGNRVNFGWQALGSDVYPRDVTWNGAEVRYFWDRTRPDPFTFATGGATLGETDARLLSVTVKVGGKLARAYSMRYDTGAAGASRLTSVVQYGRDAVVNASGFVISGSSLPAPGFVFPAGGASFDTTFLSGMNIRDNGAWNKRGDIDGNGCTDFIAITDADNGTAQICFFERDGTFARIHFDDLDLIDDSSTLLVADFDGDEQADVFSYIDGSFARGAYVNYSRGDHFKNPWYDLELAKGKLLVADFDGDGRADVLSHRSNGADVYVHYSNGDGFDTYRFSESKIRIEDDDFAMNYVSDVDGDGKADVINLNEDGGGSRKEINVNYSLGRTWKKELFTTGDTHKNAAKNRVGDFNGDGKADLLAFVATGKNATVSINYSIGHGIELRQYTLPYVNDKDIGRNYIADFNGDGRSDVLALVTYNHTTSATAWLSLANGDGFTSALIGGLALDDGGNKVDDWNGDGRADVLTIWKSTNDNHSTAYLNAGVTPRDLLEAVDNGAGAVTSVEYTPSTAWPKLDLPAGFIMQTVTAETTRVTGGATSSQTFAYANGAFSRAERRFLGFQTITATLDGAGNQAILACTQTLASAGKPLSMTYAGANGAIWAKTDYEYDESTTAPYRSNLVKRWDHEYDLGPTARTSLVENVYDTYGNLKEKREHGDWSVSGDERTTKRDYYPETSLYVVGLPGRERALAGIGGSGTRLRETQWTYDSTANTYKTPPVLGNLVREAKWDSVSTLFNETLFTFDSWGNVTSQTDPLGNLTTTTYDSARHLFPLARVNALGQVAAQTWDTVLGRVITETDPNGVPTFFAYDVFGRQQQKVLADGRIVTFSYEARTDGQRVRETRSDGSAAGLWEETRLDGLGRVIRRTRSDGASQRTEFSDTSKRPLRQSHWTEANGPLVWETWSYDALGRVTRLTHDDGSHADVAYDVDTITVVDERGRRRELVKDVFGRTTVLREYVGGATQSTTYGYDLLDRMTSIVDVAGRTATFKWSSLGWKTKSIDLDAGTWTYTYDKNGRLVSQKDARTNIITLTYDALGRPLEKTWPGGVVAARWSWDDPQQPFGIGRLGSVAYPEGGESYVYDALGRVADETRVVAGTAMDFGYAYDAAGRIAAITYPDGEVVAQQYGTDGQLSAIPGYVESLAFDARGKVRSLTLANGTTSGFTYDACHHRLLSMAIADGGGASLLRLDLSRDAVGNVVQLRSDGMRSDGSSATVDLSLSLDELDRLTAASGTADEAFTYDATGNITSSAAGTYSYADTAHVHAVTSVGSTIYKYDANGNMTKRGTQTLVWDADNHLTSVKASGSELAAFGYDANGRRVRKTANGRVTLYFGPLVELRDGTLVKNYYAGAAHVARRDAHRLVFLHTDHLGSVRMMTDTAGAVVESNEYSAFGVATTAADADTARGFGGHAPDAETGLLYLNARYYDPRIGRFLSPDPIVGDIGDPQGLNRYSYARNNPFTVVDPSGHLNITLDDIARVVTVVAAAATGPYGWAVYVAAAGGALYLYGKETGNKDALMIGDMLMSFSAGAGRTGWIATGLFEAAVSANSPLDPQMKENARIAYAGYLWASGKAKPDFSKWNDGLLHIRQTRGGDVSLHYSFPIKVSTVDPEQSSENQTFQFRASAKIHGLFGSSGSSNLPGVQTQNAWYPIVNAATSSSAVPSGGGGHLSFPADRLLAANGQLDAGNGGLSGADGGSLLPALCFNGMIGPAATSPLPAYALGAASGNATWSGEPEHFKITQQ